MAALFTELALIRWIPANVPYVAFYANLVLIASFLGIGLGILVGARTRSSGTPFSVLLLLIVGLVFASKVDARFDPFNPLAAPSVTQTAELVVPLLVFVLVTATLAAIAVPLGGLFRALPPLVAYAVDIAGSVTGVLAFAACSALGLPPVVWFAIAFGLVAAGSALGGARRPTLVAFASAATSLVLLAGAAALSGDLWSPYNRISPYRTDGVLTIAANGIPHQTFHSATATGRPAFYEQVYRWLPDRRFDRVLVIGAGNGTDVATALLRGASHVDAVEIDPTILSLGVSEHPDRPYADPRVRRTVDDGRAFLRRSTDRYDLILFALTDSLTLITTSSNLRLESFLYTRESFAEAVAHLTPDGVVAVYNFYSDPWVYERLSTTLREVTGEEPLLRIYPVGNAAAHAAGPGVTQAKALRLVRDEVSPAAAVTPDPATDDWPFPYLRERAVAPFYVASLAVLLLLALGSVLGVARLAGTSLRGFSPHFFVLGVAFLLLETKSLATFALLFGTTWLVNVLAITGVLLSVLGAIAVNAWRPVPRVLLYPLLFGSLALAYALPPDRLLFETPALRYGVAVLVAFAPVFFANLVFTRSFRDTAHPDMAFASNLLGAVAGGVLEYTALITGYRQLLVLVAVLYVLAWLTGRGASAVHRERTAAAVASS
ncbi:MAG TPA: spermidine synthase [Candidatus Limnocylindria bacterium]|nr:spermidine synthase [Candidatus Limnocylindria bacterium]